MKAPLIFCSCLESINVQKIFKIVLSKVRASLAFGAYDDRRMNILSGFRPEMHDPGDHGDGGASPDLRGDVAIAGTSVRYCRSPSSFATLQKFHGDTRHTSMQRAGSLGFHSAVCGTIRHLSLL